MNYKRIFGIGPTGVVITVLIWMVAIYAEKWLGIPRIKMGTTFQWILFGLFVIDFLVTIVWALIVLPFSTRGKELIITGPFHWVRHPIYSAVIWSGTGMVAIGYRSWAVIFSVILISLFWAWYIQREEGYLLEKFGEEYREYQKTTGQFFPKFKKFDSHEN